MSNKPLQPENPYAAPQAELFPRKPEVVYVRRFNGRRAFWSGLVIGLIVLSIQLPEVDGESRGSVEFKFLGLVFTLVISLIIGALSESAVEQKASKPEEIDINAPQR